MIPYLDFVNIGLKGSSDARYHECGAVSADPVFRNLQILHDAGIFIEISTMYLYGREDEIQGAAEKVRQISPSIPFQVMRFFAVNEELTGLQPDKAQAETMCNTLRGIVDHVYLFNTPATTELDSRCPKLWENNRSPCLFRSDGCPCLIPPARRDMLLWVCISSQGRHHACANRRFSGSWRIPFNHGCQVHRRILKSPGCHR